MVLNATDKVEGFKKQLKYQVERIKNRNLDCFPLTKEFREEVEEFEVHLSRLIDAWNSYFLKVLHENIEENAEL